MISSHPPTPAGSTVTVLTSNRMARPLPSSLLLPSQPKDLTVLVVTHGGPVKVSLTALPKQRRNIVWEEETLKKATELKFKVWNCSLSEIDMIKAKSGPGQPFNGWVGAITKSVSYLLCAALCMVH
jgi:hypothetical protein